MTNEKMIIEIRNMKKYYNMPWRHRVVLAWCVAKLQKELTTGAAVPAKTLEG